MKRLLLLLLLAVSVSGCGLVEEATTGLQYTEDVSGFITEAEQLSTELPGLLEQVQSNDAAYSDVEERLQSFQKEIEGIQALHPPEVAEGLHSHLLSYTEKLEPVMNELFQAVQEQQMPLETLENSGLIQTIQQLQQIQEDLSQLGG